ncbi:MAG: TRAP transporter substrate-binding protein DctP [Moorellales bacterium]
MPRRKNMPRRKASQIVSWVLLLAVGLLFLAGGCAKSETISPAPGEQQEQRQQPQQAPIELTYGSIQSASHHYSKADQAWIDKIHKETGGRVRITPYWDGTLISPEESVAELLQGVADIGYLAPGYSKAGFEIHKGTLGFYYGIPGYDDRLRIYAETTAKFPQIEGEFAGIKILCRSVGSTYQLISTKPVRELKDMRGLKIKGTGVYNEVIKALGATPVSMPMTEVYMALDKGTIDACLAPYETLKGFKFAEVAKYVTVLNLAGSVYPTRGMNMKSWEKLPPDIQKIFEDNIEFWSNEDKKWRAAVDDEGIAFGKAQGVEFIELSPADQQKLEEVVGNVMKKEAEKLDALGLPGTAIFQEVRRIADTLR